MVLTSAVSVSGPSEVQPRPSFEPRGRRRGLAGGRPGPRRRRRRRRVAGAGVCVGAGALGGAEASASGCSE